MIEKLVLATHNKGKVEEVSDTLKLCVKHVVSAAELKLPEPEETESTFKGNALLKARAACKASGFPALADDSGLCVNALNGDPGIYSARWAEEEKGGPKNFNMAMGFIDTKLIGSKDRTAYFISVLALVMPDGNEHIFEGRINGDLVWPPRGNDGFGYDPMFQPEGYQQTFAEMDAATKKKISHRAIALQKCLNFLTTS